MRKVREVLRLYYAAGMSARAIARSLKVSPAVPAKAGMGKCIRRAEARDVSWPLPDSVGDAGLERRLFPASAPIQSKLRQTGRSNQLSTRSE